MIGITLSEKQRSRAEQLAAAQGIPNAEFRVMNALEMGFAADSFDLVWACESGEHMPDKLKYVQEMTRVLKPGGTMVVATWCQARERAPPSRGAPLLPRLRLLALSLPRAATPPPSPDRPALPRSPRSSRSSSSPRAASPSARDPPCPHSRGGFQAAVLVRRVGPPLLHLHRGVLQAHEGDR